MKYKDTAIKCVEDLPFLLTMEEVGQILRIGRNNSYDLVRCGKLRSIRIGKQIRVTKDDLLAYLSHS